jgi:acetylornithine deacetylase/succinyl-diaminopimelate desuccinylase-like protein
VELVCFREQPTKPEARRHKVSREGAVGRAAAYFDNGEFLRDLPKRVAIPTESQNPDRRIELQSYLTDKIGPSLEPQGWRCMILDNPGDGNFPFLFAERNEDRSLVTILTYGHGDVVHGQDSQWRHRSPSFPLSGRYHPMSSSSPHP